MKDQSNLEGYQQHQLYYDVEHTNDNHFALNEDDSSINDQKIRPIREMTNDDEAYDRVQQRKSRQPPQVHAMNKGQNKLQKMMSIEDNSVFSGGQNNMMVFDKSQNEEQFNDRKSYQFQSNSIFKSSGFAQLDPARQYQQELDKILNNQVANPAGGYYQFLQNLKSNQVVNLVDDNVIFIHNKSQTPAQQAQIKKMERDKSSTIEQDVSNSFNNNYDSMQSILGYSNLKNQRSYLQLRNHQMAQHQKQYMSSGLNPNKLQNLQEPGKQKFNQRDQAYLKQKQMLDMLHDRIQSIDQNQNQDDFSARRFQSDKSQMSIEHIKRFEAFQPMIKLIKGNYTGNRNSLLQNKIEQVFADESQFSKFKSQRSNFKSSAKNENDDDFFSIMSYQSLPQKINGISMMKSQKQSKIQNDSIQLSNKKMVIDLVILGFDIEVVQKALLYHKVTEPLSIEVLLDKYLIQDELEQGYKQNHKFIPQGKIHQLNKRNNVIPFNNQKLCPYCQDNSESNSESQNTLDNKIEDADRFHQYCESLIINSSFVIKSKICSDLSSQKVKIDLSNIRKQVDKKYLNDILGYFKKVQLMQKSVISPKKIKFTQSSQDINEQKLNQSKLDQSQINPNIDQDISKINLLQIENDSCTILERQNSKFGNIAPFTTVLSQNVRSNIDNQHTKNNSTDFLIKNNEQTLKLLDQNRELFHNLNINNNNNNYCNDHEKIIETLRGVPSISQGSMNFQIITSKEGKLINKAEAQPIHHSCEICGDIYQRHNLDYNLKLWNVLDEDEIQLQGFTLMRDEYFLYEEYNQESPNNQKEFEQMKIHQLINQQGENTNNFVKLKGRFLQMINNGNLNHQDFENKFRKLSEKNKELVLQHFKKVAKAIKNLNIAGLEDQFQTKPQQAKCLICFSNLDDEIQNRLKITQKKYWIRNRLSEQKHKNLKYLDIYFKKDLTVKVAHSNLLGNRQNKMV
ncbi:UNKNOWN [Stylonychia lemnae]|uniref:Uncharacterized protein n=1 Tax=Stylonychia lemnae TaxID=5949 RepID=A0A078AHI5_STYLE|nr:UNKNOWN [Stylonychia lemnae]|eukprot:CDW80957.1 UNKNOWN [Stylonychia lemnae]